MGLPYYCYFEENKGNNEEGGLSPKGTPTVVIQKAGSLFQQVNDPNTHQVTKEWKNYVRIAVIRSRGVVKKISQKLVNDCQKHLTKVKMAKRH